MMIPERWKVRAKCIDMREKTGEWISGYYMFANSSAGSIHAIYIPADNPDKAGRTLEIDPSTIEPLAVPVMIEPMYDYEDSKPSGYYILCPNCGYIYDNDGGDWKEYCG